MTQRRLHPGAFAAPAARATMTAALLVAAVALFAGGCGPSKPAAAPETAPPKEAPAPSKPAPSTMLRVASLDLSKFSGRITQGQIEELASIITEREIEVLAIQGITRYPTLKSRPDLVDGLAAATGMRNAFGETINVSGRQSGNAVLSAYQVNSSDSKAFEGVSGLNFEGALRVIVDAGARPVVVVSTLLPAPLSERDAKICLKTIEGMTAERGKDPLLVMGNLPSPAGDDWNEVGGAGGRIWYTPGPVEAGPVSSAPCPFGTLFIADLDIYPQGTR